MIEIISENDRINLVYRKLQDYRNGGVKIVWLIFPKLGEIHVHNLSKKETKICSDHDICSASLVIPGMEIGVHEVLQ